MTNRQFDARRRLALAATTATAAQIAAVRTLNPARKPAPPEYLGPNTLSPPPTGKAMPTPCPRCESTDTQAVRMIVALGTSRHSGRAEHVVNTRRGPVAIGESEHSGVAMTELARRFQAPVAHQRDLRIPLAGVVLLFPGILMIYNALAQSAELALWEVLRRLGYALIPTLLGGGLLYLFQGGDAVHQAKQRAWQERVDYLKYAWLCYRCGHDWRGDS